MIPINYVAILISAVVTMVIGFIWYGPLFGKLWSKLMGFGEMTPEKMKEMQKAAMPGYVASFVGALVMAYVLAHALVFASAYLGASGISAGLTAGFWNWLGFVAPVTLGAILWDKGKSLTLWYINGSYYLVVLLAMGAVLASMPA
ncbi:MAG: DUF1761 domain-containing protein [Patescibacteria group bacterium]